ncbi:MAG: trypsin-like serine protease [Labilithrix sp.]|nr:trypsin-like serine protease [Labilithrix sp.]
MDAVDTPQPVGRAIQAIVGGTASGKDHDAVVILARYDDLGMRAGLCTATLIAPNLVVTARHCVSATDPTAACNAGGEPVSGGALHGDRAPSTLAVFTSTGGVAPVTTVDLDAAARGKTVVVDDATNVCNSDIAFLVLDASLTTPIAPIRLGPPANAEKITAVGWGLTEIGELPAARMQRKDVEVVGNGPMAYPDDARYGAGDAEFLVGESACAGDSGSPALAKSGAVIGVASRAGNGLPRDPANAASTCVGATAHVVYAQLGAASALALRAFAEAGATPWLEGEPDPRAKNDAKPEGGAKGASDPAPTGPERAATTLGATGTRGESAAGCAASGAPAPGAAERALGFIAILAAIVRSRRRSDDAR